MDLRIYEFVINSTVFKCPLTFFDDLTAVLEALSDEERNKNHEEDRENYDFSDDSEGEAEHISENDHSSDSES